MKKLQLGALALLLSIPLGRAQAQPIVASPPEYTQVKQLAGEDPFSILKPVFSPDSAYVAAFLSNKLEVWDTKTGAVAAEIPASVHGMDSIDGLEFSNDGKLLLVLRNSQPLKYIDWKAGTVVKQIALNADPKKILGYAFSPDQNTLALGTYTGVQVWDLPSSTKKAEYLKGQAVADVDLAYISQPRKKAVRLLAYGRALIPPDVTWKNVAGVIDLDTGKQTTLLADIPAAKKVEGAMSFFFVNFEWGGSHLLIGYSQFPPKVKGEAFLVDTWTGKYISAQSLGEPAYAFKSKYLGKPYYGFVISSADLTNPNQDYQTTTQFFVPTRKGLELRDTVTQISLPMQTIRINSTNTMAAIALKRNASDTSKLYLYKLSPKKR